MAKSLKDKVRNIMSPANANKTKEEIEEDYMDNLTLQALPRRLYDELFESVNRDWKQKLNPDILFNSLPPEGLKALLPWISTGVSVVVLLIVLFK
jgi:hypothetical protein